MTTVFIAGSINIKNLDPKVKDRIDTIVKSKFEVVVGDADGADTSIQEYLLERNAESTTVFCSGTAPRNNVGSWKIRAVEVDHAPGTRAFFTAKDVEMAKAADFGLMIWDAKSTGTLSNVIELLKRNKKSVVFINKMKSFLNVSDVESLERLLSVMSPVAAEKADKKINLRAKLTELKHQQSDMFAH